MTGVYHCMQLFFIKMESCELYGQADLNGDLPDLSLSIRRITDVSHQCPIKTVFFFFLRKHSLWAGRALPRLRA
jgi:hypothetical protein